MEPFDVDDRTSFCSFFHGVTQHGCVQIKIAYKMDGWRDDTSLPSDKSAKLKKFPWQYLSGSQRADSLSIYFMILIVRPTLHTQPLYQSPRMAEVDQSNLHVLSQLVANNLKQPSPPCAIRLAQCHNNRRWTQMKPINAATKDYGQVWGRYKCGGVYPLQICFTHY